MPAVASVAELLDCPEIEEAESLSLLDGAPEPSRVDGLGKVQQRSRDACHRDPVKLGAIVRVEVADPVAPDAGPVLAAVSGAKDVDKGAGAGSDAPLGPGAPVTQEGTMPTRQNGGH